MKVYHFYQKQFIKTDIDRVWDFFSSPHNLNAITPAFMNFEILEVSGGSEKMFNGQLIKYKVSPFPFFRVQWITEITDVRPKNFFADDQKKGPFSLWHHEHEFIEKDGGVEMEDHVIYAVPFWFVGRIANTLIVQKQVRQIFEYRKSQVEMLFNR
jgi:ligand-binding SRPBCC domain-containing protein